MMSVTRFNKKNKYLAPIFVLAFLLSSCSHKGGVKEDGLFSDMENKGADVAETSPSSETEESVSATGNAPSSVADTSVSPSPESEKTALLDAEPPREMTSLPAPEEPKALTAETTVAPPPVVEDSSQLNSVVDSAAPTTEPTLASVPTTEETKSEVSSEPKPTKSVKSATSKKVAQIPEEPIWKKGLVLNRYYFLRQGDTAESLSKTIYGSADRAKDIQDWNHGAWYAGKVVMFESPSQKDDDEMKSLFEEKSVSANEYTVKSGDSLSKIAEKSYGSSKSWVEIAAHNKLSNPNSLSVGNKLMLFPSQLPESKPLAAAKTEEAPKVEVPEVKSAPQPPVSQIQPEKAQSPQAVAAPVKTVDKEEQLASAEVGGFIENYFSYLLIGLLIAVGAFFLLRKFAHNPDGLE